MAIIVAPYLLLFAIFRAKEIGNGANRRRPNDGLKSFAFFQENCFTLFSGQKKLSLIAKKLRRPLNDPENCGLAVFCTRKRGCYIFFFLCDRFSLLVCPKTHSCFPKITILNFFWFLQKKSRSSGKRHFQRTKLFETLSTASFSP